MSENFQQENIIRKLQDALDSIDEKYHDDTENCANCMEKLNLYFQFVTDLNKKDSSSICQQDVEAKNAKVQEDLSTIRDCFDSREAIDKQAIASLSEGKMTFASEIQFTI